MAEHDLPEHLTDLEPISISVAGKRRRWNINDPELPDWITDEAMASGGYPYDKRLSRKKYERQLEALQKELVKLQYWLQETGQRVVAVFEGRDAAGKGGTIARLRQYMNPRSARNVALPKPTDAERGQWYFQRYAMHLPTSGEFVTYDRSWYNRGGVEPVMGFCTDEQHREFLIDAPEFEKIIVGEGIRFFKFWLNIGQEMQLKRFHDRRHSPLKIWKFSPIDIAGVAKWDDYTRRRDEMLAATDSKHAPWTVVRANDKRRARTEVCRRVLSALPYDGKNEDAIGTADNNIIGSAGELLGAGS
ncbi:MAG: polyphosphate kinase 2 [Rhizobiaceae bacterium]